MTSLSPESHALLEAYRTVSDVEDRPDDAVFERIESAIESPPAEPPRRAAAWLVAGVAVASTVTAVLAWPGPGLATIDGPAPVTEAVESARDAAPNARADPSTPVRPEPTPSTMEAEPPPEPPRPEAFKSVSPNVVSAPADADLVAELGLLREARLAMQRGDLVVAAKALNEHGRVYPGGQLSEDRDALWVVLRCRKGSRNDGRAAFEAAHPSSHHLVAIRTACDEEK